MKKYLSLILALQVFIAGCSKIDKITGDYELEASGDLCHLLDIKMMRLDASSITLKGGGSTDYLDLMASLSKAPSNKIAQVKINISRHSQGITTKFTEVEVSDVSIKMAEWDKKSLTPEKILFTKQYTLKLENGKKTSLYSDEKERLGLEDYKECIFRK